MEIYKLGNCEINLSLNSTSDTAKITGISRPNGCLFICTETIKGYCTFASIRAFFFAKLCLKQNTVASIPLDNIHLLSYRRGNSDIRRN